jgi:hypothetical protein
MGELDKTDDGLWAAAGMDPLRMAVASWQGGAVADRQSDLRFLSTFAVYLVQHFRAEEARLDRAKAPDRAWRRSEHHRLVRQLQNLMADLELGREVTGDIYAFLDAWSTQLESRSLGGEVRPPVGYPRPGSRGE